MTSVRTPLPDATAGAVVYRSRRRQWLIAAGMIGLFILLWSQTQQPDYETHVKPTFSKYVWELAPFLVLTIVMAVRAFRVRVVTTAEGVHLYRVLGHRFVPWWELVGIEIHPTPSGRLTTVKLRLDTKLTVKVATYRLRGGHSAEAESLAAQLRADREARVHGR